MRDDSVSRKAVMESLKEEYNRRLYNDGFTPDFGLKLAWIEKAVNAVPALDPKSRGEYTEAHASDLRSIKELLAGLRELVWLRDIPSPTVPEYIEHHKAMVEIMQMIDTIIAEVDTDLAATEDDCK